MQLGIQRAPSSSLTGYQGSPAYSTRPQTSGWNSGPRPMVRPYVPTTSSRTAQQLLQQQQQQQQQQNQSPQTIAPHLHPAYSGRGRPPLALGRRLPGTTTPSSKRSSGSHTQVHSQHSSTAGPSVGVTSSNAAAAAAAASTALQPRSRKIGDGKETSYLGPGSTNRLLLSLRSGLPSHVSWALTRLINASCHQPEALSLDAFPGMTDSLLRFPRRLVAALKGEEVEKWEPTFWEQDERQLDGFGKGSWQEIPASEEMVPSTGEEDEDDADKDDEMNRIALGNPIRLVRSMPAVFQPDKFPSHMRLIDHAVAAMLILRNLAMNERNERIFLAYSRTMNHLISDILAFPYSTTTVGPTSAGHWSDWQGMDEMRVYALDLLEVTRIRLHIRRRCSLVFDAKGEPISEPAYSEPTDLDGIAAAANAAGTPSKEDERVQAAQRANAGISDYIFNLLVWHLHTTQDRSVLLGCLRCLGALAAEEKNEVAFVETDQAMGERARQAGTRRLTVGLGSSTISSPGILKKCLTLLPLTSDSALLEATLDCLYQVINIGDNALRLATCLTDGVAPLGTGIARLEAGLDEARERGVGDVRNAVRLLARNLIYGRVVWDRTHQLTLHPALHSHVPSAVALRRRERDEVFRRRRIAEADERERPKLRRLQRKEWLDLKDLPEPERLKAWMSLIYEAKEGGEVTQMEFWTTYSNQFGPYASLGGPALQPAAEVIRTVSSVFPGALAMVIQNQKFIVRGVEARDRSMLRRFECKWHSCHTPETEAFEAVEGHARVHASMAVDGKCHWATCTYVVPFDKDQIQGDRTESLRQHILTHLPELDWQIEVRDAEEKRRYEEEVSMLTRSLKSQAIKREVMPNGARYISGPTALMPNSTFPAQKRKLEMERQEAKRRKLLNAPTRGTVDLPDSLVFSVTRTPMDPDTGKPIGISSTSGLILRSLARTTATILIKAGVREKRKVQNEGEGEVPGLSERFGLPLPSSGGEKDSQTNAVDSVGDLPEAGGASAGIGGVGPVEDWALQAASRIMDALLEVEEQLMTVASENDILCPILNETLVELKAEPGHSLIPTQDHSLIVEEA